MVEIEGGSLLIGMGAGVVITLSFLMTLVLNHAARRNCELGKETEILRDDK